MRDGWHIDSSTGTKIFQKMHQADGKFKGLKAILEERGIDPPKLGKCQPKHRAAAGLQNTSECPSSNACCCYNVSALNKTFWYFESLNSVDSLAYAHIANPITPAIL
jgi:hypothetical protein